VSGGSDLPSDMALDGAIRAQERSYLDRTVQRLERFPNLSVSSALLDGPVVDALADYARCGRADLIVMTTHGRGPLSRFWLGSVADNLMRLVSQPLLLTRPQEPAPDLKTQPVLRHVWIPLDGSELAEQILGPALALGKLAQADYTLLRVVEPVILPDYHFAGNVASGVDPEMLRKLRSEAQDYLNRVADRLRDQGNQVQTRVVLNRPAADAILEEVHAHAGSVIAVATHGRGGIARLLLGSVADKVVRGATVPVLIQRPLNS
jgi:nucleotide-binding universal stress UspA family protein